MAAPTGKGTAVVPQRPMGSQGFVTSAQGLGCMGMTSAYGLKDATEEGSLATIRRARELGVTLLDTADVYGNDTNEKLVGKAVAEERSNFQIATKFAYAQSKDNPQEFAVRGEPEYVRQAFAASVKNLSTDYVDMYYQHRCGDKTPIEDTVRAMAELVKTGKVKYLGLSEVSPDQLRRAHAVHPITAVQLEWSLWTREAEKDVIPLCRELGIAIVAYSPLGRGLLTGQIKSIDDLAEDDFRRFVPRFSAENFHKNLELVDKVKEVAARHSATPGQVALAWLHAQGKDVFPIPGTKRVERLEENVAAFALQLTAADLEELDNAFPHGIATGGRYPEALMEGVHISK